MKLFFLVFFSMSLVNLAFATESNQLTQLHSSVKEIFVDTAGEGSLSKLLSSTKLLDNLKKVEYQNYSEGSFQEKTEPLFTQSGSNSKSVIHNDLAENGRDNFLHSVLNDEHHHLVMGQLESYFRSDRRDDYVSLPVPEPETYGLMLVGLLMLGAAKGRKF